MNITYEPKGRAKEFASLAAFALIILLNGSIFPGTSVSGQIYKWVDENGVAHFTDCPNVSTLKNCDVEVVRVPDYEKTPPLTEQHIQEKAAKEVKEKGEEQSLKQQQAVKSKHREQGEEPQKQVTAAQMKIRKKKEIKNKQPNKQQSGSKSVIQYKHTAKKSRKPVQLLNTQQRLPSRSLNEYEKKRKEIKKYNDRGGQYNTRLQKEYEKQKRAYEKKQKEIEQYNAQVREHNTQLQKGRGNKGPFPTRHKQYQGSMRKPYLGDDDPHRPYYRRHPAARGRGNKGPFSTQR
ncbi:MAG: DUF4124 domain-containing protein [Desulfobacterales bacterium]|nr:DUF4124 domain-containing protein [Desulfobacterales bacterium]